MELGRYRRSPIASGAGELCSPEPIAGGAGPIEGPASFGERASERQRGLAVNQSRQRALRRFESCRSHERKRGGGIPVPPTPHWLGTGLLNRTELVRFQPAATSDCTTGYKL